MYRTIKTYTDSELLQVILRTQKTLLKESQGIYSIAQCDTVEELKDTYNLTKPQALTVLATFELSKRLAAQKALSTPYLDNCSKVAEYLIPLLRYENHEKFLVILLNTKNKVIRVEQVSESILNGCLAHPREVFVRAITAHAAHIIVAHNHPSGDIEPSEEDRLLTKRLKAAGNILGIPLLDHFIIGDGRYYSFKEAGEI